MKKLLIMLSTVTLGTTNAHAISSLVNNAKSNNFANDKFMSALSNNLELDQISIDHVDWREVRNNVNDMFTNNSLSDSMTDEELEMLNCALNNSLEYLSDFELRNASYTEVINELKNNSMEFKNEYEYWIKPPSQNPSSYNNIDDIIKNIIEGVENRPDMGPIEDAINKIRENPDINIPDGPIYLSRTEESRQRAIGILDGIDLTGRVASSLSVAAGLVAAGLWAAAWFFGFSIPYAIAATAASAALGALAAIITFFINTNELNIKNVKSSPLDVALTVFKGIMAEAKVALLLGLWVTTTVLTATSWIVPFVMGLAGTIVEIAAWIYWFQPEIID